MMQENLWRVLEKSIPRILSQLDRDPHSPTFGSFDRDFWHYKIRDFSSMVLQQGAIILHVLGNTETVGNPFFRSPIVEDWLQGSLAFWARSQLRSGSFNEYYPFEHGFPPTAFSLYTTGILLRSRQYQATPEVLRSVQKAIDWLLNHQEKSALNQEIAALAGIALCSDLPGISVDRIRYEQRLTDFFASQSAEGWFPEYDGPDLGYLSVTIDCLYDYFLVTRDQRAFQAMTRAIDFMHTLLVGSTELPVMINSRNTGYIVPYGIVRMAENYAPATEIVSQVFADIEDSRHFLHKIDDRYSCHYVYQSCFRALSFLDQMKRDEPIVPSVKTIFFEHSGILVKNLENGRILVSARKGGVIYLLGRKEVLDCDYGWRLIDRKACSVNHWQDNDYVCQYSNETLTIRGNFSRHGWIVQSVWKSVALRFLSLFFGNRLIPWLKDIMIFNHKSAGIFFVRKIEWKGDALYLRDEFQGDSVLIQRLEPAPHYSLRHVASAGSFEFEELLFAKAKNGWVKNPEGGFSRTMRPSPELLAAEACESA